MLKKELNFLKQIDTIICNQPYFVFVCLLQFSSIILVQVKIITDSYHYTQVIYNQEVLLKNEHLSVIKAFQYYIASYLVQKSLGEKNDFFSNKGQMSLMKTLMEKLATFRLLIKEQREHTILQKSPRSFKNDVDNLKLLQKFLYVASSAKLIFV